MKSSTSQESDCGPMLSELQPAWPPATIKEWVLGGGVSTPLLIAELREWLTYWERDADTDCGPAHKALAELREWDMLDAIADASWVLDQLDTIERALPLSPGHCSCDPDFCCTACGRHATPHRRCILR